MRKIVYLVEQPLDERNYDRFGIQAWNDKGWDVEIWDFTPWVHPSVWRDFIKSGKKLQEFSGYFPIASKSQLKQRSCGPDRITHFIDLAGEDFRIIWAKISLMRMGAIRVVCATGSIPEPDCKKKNLISRLRKVFARGPVKTIKWLANGFIHKLAAPFIKPGLVVVSGEKSIPSTGCSHEILKAHNLDYDIYLRIAKSNGMSSGGYAVFIDQDYCFHPEFVYQGIPPMATPEKYFPAICNGLRTISSALGVNLCVAVHPRSVSQKKPVDCYYEGIPIEYGSTAQLVRDCSVVVGHDSTAIQFAVLFGKPVIFVTTDELNAQYFDSSYKREEISFFASEFGKSVINLDRDLDNVDWQKELSVDERKYAEYKKKYIKIDGSPEIPFWEIVADHIENERR